MGLWEVSPPLCLGVSSSVKSAGAGIGNLESRIQPYPPPIHFANEKEWKDLSHPELVWPKHPWIQWMQFCKHMHFHAEKAFLWHSETSLTPKRLGTTDPRLLPALNVFGLRSGKKKKKSAAAPCGKLIVSWLYHYTYTYARNIAVKHRHTQTGAYTHTF